MDLVRILLAVLLPPLGVFLQGGATFLAEHRADSPGLHTRPCPCDLDYRPSRSARGLVVECGSRRDPCHQSAIGRFLPFTEE
jgi:hypothetical protein